MEQIQKITEEMRLQLRAPLPAEAVKQNPSKTHLSTIKAIYVTERLNEVFGVGAWQIRTDLVTPIVSEVKTAKSGRQYNEFTALMKTVLTIPAYGVYYECIAGSTNEDEGDSAKGGTTDGITKICSWMEIGISVFKGEGNKPAQQTQAPRPVQDKPQQANVQQKPANSATAKQQELILKLNNSSVFTAEEKGKIVKALPTMTVEKAAKCIEYLQTELKTRKEATHAS